MLLLLILKTVLTQEIIDIKFNVMGGDSLRIPTQIRNGQNSIHYDDLISLIQPYLMADSSVVAIHDITGTLLDKNGFIDIELLQSGSLGIVTESRPREAILADYHFNYVYKRRAIIKSNTSKLKIIIHPEYLLGDIYEQILEIIDRSRGELTRNNANVFLYYTRKLILDVVPNKIRDSGRLLIRLNDDKKTLSQHGFDVRTHILCVYVGSQDISRWMIENWLRKRIAMRIITHD